MSLPTQKRFIDPWFISVSLGADYGTYECQICHRTFYHSPSAVELNKKELYKCVCGNCANKILRDDHGTTYFE